MRPLARTVKQLDADSMRALAHPLRVRIVGWLRRHGSATATMLGDALGESSGATSYHLRVLARHGFVAEEPDRGTGRERWWHAAQGTTSWRPEDVRDDPRARAAEEWLTGFHGRQAMEWIDDWLQRRSDEADEWVAVADTSDYGLRMTPGEVRAMVEEVHAVLARHRDAAEEADRQAAGEGRRLVRLLLFALPQEADPAPDPGPAR